MANVKKQNDDFFSGAENKIIRNIIIITLDPFGTDIADTSAKPRSYLEKGGNRLHIKTRKFAIKNRILVSEGDVIDKIKLQESERIIRSSEFISDVTIRIDTNYTSKDSVDIVIRTQDRWSINGSASAGGGNFGLKANDKNILGTGQQLELSVFKAQLFDSTAINQRLSYFAPYIKHTFITAGVVLNNERGNQFIGSTINRTFFSPLTKLAGGFDLYNYSSLVLLKSVDSAKIDLFNLRYWTEDAWLGYALPIKGSKFYKRTTKFIVAGRFYNKHYQNAPSHEFDPVFFNQNETNYLVQVGFTRRGYYKDKYVYKYGVTEDIPIGALFSVIAGYQERPTDIRYYFGFKSGFGMKLRGGNASIYYEMGSYTNTKKAYEQGTINTGIQGFTNLVKLPHGILYRQFVSLGFTIGFNRNEYDRITISNAKGLSGFNPLNVTGSNRMVFSTSAIFYLPWQALGFRIAPIFYGGFGMIGDEKVSFVKDNVFPVLGFGIQIRNEYLILSSFLLTVGYYPYIPNAGSNIVKLNPFGTNSFQFQNFEIGKPTIVNYYGN